MNRQILCWNCINERGDGCSVVSDDIKEHPRTRCGHYEAGTDQPEYCRCTSCEFEIETQILDETEHTSFVQRVICARKKKSRVRTAQRNCTDYIERQTARGA